MNGEFMRRFGSILVILICFLLLPQQSHAGACWQPLPVEHIERSDIVFFGEIMRTRKTLKEDVSKTVTFRVIRGYKGVKSDTIEIAPHPFGDTKWDIPYYQPMMVFARFVDDATPGKTIATTTACSLRPYETRQELHPKYWELVVAMSKEDASGAADDEK